MCAASFFKCFIINLPYAYIKSKAQCPKRSFGRKEYLNWSSTQPVISKWNLISHFSHSTFLSLCNFFLFSKLTSISDFQILKNNFIEQKLQFKNFVSDSFLHTTIKIHVDQSTYFFLIHILTKGHGKKT